MKTRYIEISKYRFKRRYLNLNKSLFIHIWNMFIAHKTDMRYHDFGKRSLLRLTRHKMLTNCDEAIIQLPFEGDSCLSAANGFLIFDYKRKKVIKLFRPEVPMEQIERELESLQKVSNMDFAPAIRRSNIRERWYEMEYITGISGESNESARNDYTYFKIYEEDVSRCIEQLMTLQPPQYVGLKEYTATLTDSLHLDWLYNSRVDEKVIDDINCFIDSVIKRLDGEGDIQIPLVFSHGDFSYNNFIKSRNRFTVIDWEDAGLRSPLYDFYTYIFNQIIFRKLMMPESSIYHQVMRMKDKLENEKHIVASTLHAYYRIFRLLFYIERLSVILNHRRDSVVLDTILPSIKVFGAYENNSDYRLQRSKLKMNPIKVSENNVRSDTQPLVSIITPVYNGDKYIAECIESVLSQTYENWEYIIVNNCSTDRTAEIAQAYAERNSRITIHNNDKFMGMVQNHNHALRLISASSKYCKMVHADDLLYPECIERMVQVAERNPRVGLVSSYRLNGEEVDIWGLSYTDSVISGREVCRRTLLGDINVFGNPSSQLMRREILGLRNPFYEDLILNTDAESCYYTLKYFDFGFVHQVLAYTRVHDEQVTAQAHRYSFLPGKLNLLMKYGPVYLRSDEYEHVLRQLEKKYYRYLAQNLLARREREFWEYQRARLKDMGNKIDSVKLLKATLLDVCDIVFNPKTTIERVLK